MADADIQRCSKHSESRTIENVLVLQGGGSLGAFGCGVFKALYNSGIRFEIVGGTSIGAVNAAIICGSKSGNPAKDLEDFWIEIAESSFEIIPDMFIPYYDYKKGTIDFRRMSAAPLNAIMFGVPSFFVPRWLQINTNGSTDDMSLLLPPSEWTFFYDHSRLTSTLEKYVDYNRFSRKARKAKEDSNPRLIATAVNILTAEALIFDSDKMDITPQHILASCAYSAYGFPWVKVGEAYAWDGSLLSNTPLKEIIEASPRNDKNVFLVENYPRKINRMPVNRSEIVDRTRDIMFSDKTIYDLRAWKHMSRQTELIEMLYDIFEKNVEKQSLDPAFVNKIRGEYENLVGKYGAEILAIHRIARNRMESPHILKNADFSVKTIKELIRQGEEKTLKHLRGYEDVEVGEFLKLLYL
ncbi:MAG: hypothetical protein DA330_00700 [Nitrososphaera sp.]|nr:hypothetical protein [Nitrososphaera sp.]